jgi:hypothetical protein
MLPEAENDLISHIGPETPMGESFPQSSECIASDVNKQLGLHLLAAHLP